MVATPEFYAAFLDHFGDTESLTVLTVANASAEQVAAILELNLSAPADPDDLPEGEDLTRWTVNQIGDHVLGVEATGYGDPSLDALRAITAAGNSAAVVRANIQGHLRFGCARAGAVLFDDHEYLFISDPDVVPGELRPLFDLVWDDLAGDVSEHAEGPDGFAVALAMAELVTGVELTPAIVEATLAGAWYEAPQLRYVGGGE